MYLLCRISSFLEDNQEYFEFKNDRRKGESNAPAANQAIHTDSPKQDYEFSENKLFDPQTLATELSSGVKANKLDMEWEPGEEASMENQENNDGGIHIHELPLPHHYPVTFPDQLHEARTNDNPENMQRNENNSRAEVEKNETTKSYEIETSPKELPYTTEVKVTLPISWTENQRLGSKFDVIDKDNNNKNRRLDIKLNVTKVQDIKYQDQTNGHNSSQGDHHKNGSRNKKGRPKGILQRLLNDKPKNDIQPYSICPYLGLRKANTVKNDAKCKKKVMDETSCKEAYVAYEIDQQPLQCDKLQGKTEICSYDRDGNMQCNMSVCGERYVQLASIDPNYGIVRHRESRIFIDTNQELEQLLDEYSNMNKENGFNFCFLKCKSSSAIHPNVEQLIMFPPIVSSGPTLEPPLININILLLDSVSRPHFYRTLQKSVQTLRNIVHNPKIKATVLDYELFQSMADYTFHNIRVFMSGKTDFHYKEHKEQHYEIEYLFKNMKSKGYHTLLQEDSCWYDEWGSLYTDNLFQGKKPETLKDFKKRWKTFKNSTKKYYIDDYGLSHFSCEALQRYNITNQFNQPRKICFGGKVFAVHFLDYIEKVYSENIHSKRPIFSYTHLNTGHEVSGTRIKQLDERLSVFFDNMARKENTLTLVFSDHGPKTTKYAFRTMSGRSEIYDSLMFLIVPEKVASLLGYQRTKALITNQKRLTTALDLHHTFMNIDLQIKKTSRSSSSRKGIFAEISPNRTCSDVPIKISAICKCDGWDQNFPNNHPPFIWMAELALGILNNKIQKEYTKGMEGEGGFGKCQRLAGKRFEKIRRRAVGTNYIVTMDLIVIPEFEIFEVQIEYPKTPHPLNNEVKVIRLSRISIYRRFEKCKDESVELTHCVCKSRKNSAKNSANRQWIAMDTRKNLLRILSRSVNFGAQVKFTDLHASCLIMVTRSHSSRTSVFEIANGCTNRSYRVKVTGKSRGKTITSTSFPIILQVKPLTAHFLFSVYHLEKPYGFKATTSYKAYFVEE